MRAGAPDQRWRVDDCGQPRYSRADAEEVVAARMSVAAPSPLELAMWIGEQIR